MIAEQAARISRITHAYPANMLYLRTAPPCASIRRQRRLWRGVEEVAVSSHHVSRCLTSLAPQTLHKPGIGGRFPLVRGF